MTIIVDKDLKTIVLNREGISSGEDKVFHIEQNADLVLIGIEEVIYKEEEE